MRIERALGWLLTIVVGVALMVPVALAGTEGVSTDVHRSDQMDRTSVPVVRAADGPVFPTAVLVDSVQNYSNFTPMGMAFDGTHYWQIGGGLSSQFVAQLAADFTFIVRYDVNIDCRSIFMNPADSQVYIKSYSRAGAPVTGGELLRLHTDPFDGGFDTVLVNIFQDNQVKAVVSPDGLFLYDQFDGAARRYNATTGAVVNSFALAVSHSGISGESMAHTGTYLLTFADSTVYSFDASTGALVGRTWIPPFARGGTSVYSLSYANGFLFLTNNTASKYYVFAMDGFSAKYVGPAADTQAVLTRDLKVAYSGGVGPATGTAYYKPGGSLTYSTAPMTAGTGDTMVYTLPTGLQTVRGLDFYFKVVREGYTRYTGGARTLDFNMNNAQAQTPTALPDASYRMVSLPVDLTGSNAVSAVFADDLGDPDGGRQWRMFRHDAAGDSLAEYPSLPVVTSERAYWLIARGAKRYGAAGLSRRPNRIVNFLEYYEIPLESGWNQLGNPMPFDVSILDILLDTNGVIVGGVPFPDALISDTAYLYDGAAYQSVTTVPAWQGVFVEARQSGMKILVRYREASPPPPLRVAPREATPSSEHWTVCLRLDGDRSYDDGNFLGVRADAERGRDRYDYSEPPPAPEGAQLAFRLPDGDDTKLKRSDYRPPFKDGESWQIEFSQAVNQRLTVTGIAQLPAGMEAVLILEDGHAYALHEGSIVELPDDAMTGRLVVGTSDFAAQEKESVRPDAYELHQNFPNPFNPSTSIRFSLPEAADVSLAIYNVLGQQVRVLTDRYFEAGTHDLVWDGRDERGQSVASGVYFYRLVTPAFVDDRRMVFLK